MPGTASITCRRPEDHVASITASPAQVAGGSTAAQTIKDISFAVTTNTVGTLAYDIAQSVPQFKSDWTLTSNTPAICTVLGNRVTKISDGIGIVRASGSCGFAKLISLDFSSTTTVLNVWTGVPGVTSSSKLSNPILALLVLGKGKNYFTSTYLPGSTSIAKNTNCWAAPLNITGSAVFTSLGDSFNSGALITPQHWVGVAHWGSGNHNMGPGSELLFLGSDGTIHTRTVLRRDYNLTKDRIVCLLDTALPASVTPFKLAGLTMIDAANQRLLGMGWQITQERNVTPVGFDDFAPNFKSLKNESWAKWDSTFVDNANPAHRLNGLSSLLQTGRPGDSGGAIGGYYNGETYLISLASSSISGVLYSFAQAPELNAIIASLDTAQGISTGYTVRVLNLL